MGPELKPDLSAQLLKVNASRGAAVLAIALDGLRATITDARAGDLEARKAIRHIRGILKEIDALGALVLPGDD